MSWDYLIVTASNEAQGNAYDRQLTRRRELGLLPDFRHVMVVTDPEGKRVGSGGSTVLCVMRVLDRELPADAAVRNNPAAIETALRKLRIMIVHAGGDSRRLPAYGPCGKIFIPVPGDPTGPLAPTLFDRVLPSFLALAPGKPGAGQVMVTSGDALLNFNPAPVRMDAPGLVALGCFDTPEHSSKHGVFVPEDQDASTVKCYLQKPKPAEQAATGALNADGKSALDIGVMSFDAAALMLLLKAFDVAPTGAGPFVWKPEMHQRILSRGLDLYREICCALGTQASREHYFKSARASGSTWEDDALNRIYDTLRPMPFHLQVVPHCTFMHFGTTRQLITSGQQLIQQDKPGSVPPGTLSLNNLLSGSGLITGSNNWVEGCRITAPLTLGGYNVVVGADITHPFSLPANLCLDIVPGYNRKGEPVHFVRYYGLSDTFKDSVSKGGTFCGIPLLQWLAAMDATPEDIWSGNNPVEGQSLWDARVFPAVHSHGEFRDWAWIGNPSQATPARKKAFLAADRYSAADVAVMTNQEAFTERRK